IGKSTFLSELAKRAPSDTCVVTLDFAQKTLREDYLTFLENVSQQVESYCDPERTVELRKSIADGRYEIGKRVAGGNTKIGEIKQGITTGSDAEVHDAGLTIELGETSILETRRQMREASKEKFYAQMKTFSMKRLVVMLDTCEWLNENTTEAEAARWAGSELFKGLHSRMRNQGKSCYVVMASRVPLQLEGINDFEIDQLKLKMLNKVEVNQCLEAMEIHDPAIQDYIYNVTYGHPHSIAIIDDIWEEQWDRPLSVADLPRLKGLFYERAIQDIIDKDVLKRLLKSPLDVLTFYGVLLRRFNLPLLQAVFKEWLPEPEASNRFNQLVRYPHVEPLGDYNYIFNILLREILTGYIQVQEPDKWRRYHHLALDFLTQSSLRSPDWYYHQLACDEEKGVSYWNDVKTREPREYIDTLREAARDKTLTLTPATMQCMDIHRDTFGNII
ncbi:MAG TPA: hypothetical protein VIX20_04830, partial [Ktedonobacteraceae bacterium]